MFISGHNPKEMSLNFRKEVEFLANKPDKNIPEYANKSTSMLKEYSENAHFSRLYRKYQKVLCTTVVQNIGLGGGGVQMMGSWG